MNALDSSLETLAFDCVSFGSLTSVNNIWTWVAVITAAVSFWRIRATGTRKSDPRHQNPYGSPQPVSSSPSDTAVKAAEPSSTSASLTTTTTWAPSVRAVEATEGTTRGKFTVYYENDREGKLASAGKVDDGVVGGFGKVGPGDGEYWCKGWEWERTLRIRMGDEIGWYRHQDLTVIDGNVVRLWHDCRRRSNTVSFSGIVMW